MNTQDVKLEVTRIDMRPDGLMSDMLPGSRHYRCVLRRNGRQYTCYYSAGPAHTSPPSVAELLQCLAIDASCVRYDSFREFCDEFGYTDRAEARRIYDACNRTLEGLEMLGFDLDELLLLGDSGDE